MPRPPPPPFVPPPGPQVGDRVLFYFATPGSTRLGSRAAKIVNIWTGDNKTIAQLEVEFTDDEVKQWGFARTQLHTPLATHPKSGTWVRLPVASQ